MSTSGLLGVCCGVLEQARRLYSSALLRWTRTVIGVVLCRFGRANCLLQRSLLHRTRRVTICLLGSFGASTSLASDVFLHRTRTAIESLSEQFRSSTASPTHMHFCARLRQSSEIRCRVFEASTLSSAASSFDPGEERHVGFLICFRILPTFRPYVVVMCVRRWQRRSRG